MLENPPLLQILKVNYAIKVLQHAVDVTQCLITAVQLSKYKLTQKQVELSPHSLPFP